MTPVRLDYIAALATDYDETIACNGLVSREVFSELTLFRESGRKLLLDTGRTLPDLMAVFPALDLFDLVIVENGAVIYDPQTERQTLLADPPPPRLLKELRSRGVPLLAGDVVLETSAHFAPGIAEAIEVSDVPRELTFNKSSVLILPPGVHKGSGLLAALDRFGISPEETAAIGDAQNDHDLLAAAGLPVAVPNAIPELKARAQLILSVTDLIGLILGNHSTRSAAPA